MHRAPFIAFLAPIAAACGLSLLVQNRAEAGFDARLYVSGIYGLESFRLFGGLPDLKPDATYPQPFYQPEIAVDPGGNLYEASGFGAVGTVEVFPLNSQSPSRTILVPQSCPYVDYIDSIAVDGRGFLYVAVDNWMSGQRPLLPRSAARQKHGACRGVLIYGPADSFPIQAFRLPAEWFYGMALDQHGDLFVDDGGSEVLEYADPIANPKRIRTFSNADVINLADGLATDSQGDLYILVYTQSGGTAVAIYRPQDDPKRPPSKTIMLGELTDVEAGPDIALRQPYLYVSDGNGNLFVYNLGDAPKGRVVSVMPALKVAVSPGHAGGFRLALGP